MNCTKKGEPATQESEVTNLSIDLKINLLKQNLKQIKNLYVENIDESINSNFES